MKENSGTTSLGLSGLTYSPGSNANEANQTLTYTITGLPNANVDELGVFVTDDASGTVNGLAPGASGYTQAALQRRKVILSAIANSPNGYNNNVVNSLLEFPSGSDLRFYLVKNSTTSNVLAGNTPSSDVLFLNSTNQQIQSSGVNTYSLNWNDASTGSSKNLVVNIQPTTGPAPLGTNLQVSKGLEVIDLRGITKPVDATFTLNREATYNNTGGFYPVLDAAGEIKTNDGTILHPGGVGYAQAAVASRVQGLDMTVANQSTATFTSMFQGGTIYAPFLISNGTPSEVLNGGNHQPSVFFPFIQGNSDNFDHVRLLGNNIFAFEDQLHGGDKDYNDMIMRISLHTTT